MKSGTTSLYHYLNSHPEICMSAIKEPNYYLGGDEYKKGLSWYSSLFKNSNAKVFGEASTNYSKKHRWAGVPQRIYKDIPNAKMIYLVRDPIERIVSHYIHNVAQGREKKSFKDAVVPDSIYIQTSMYFFQIEEWLKYFVLDKILFLESYDLQSQTENELYKVFKFLGVSTEVDIKDIDKKFHKSSEKMMKSYSDNVIHSERIKKLVTPFLPTFLTKNKPVDTPVIDESHLQQIKDALRRDINKYRIITNENYKHWSI